MSTAEELTNQGIELKNAGKKEEAIEKYNQAIALDPKFGRAYSCRGFIYATTDRYQQAYDSYSLAIENGVNDSAVHYNRANMLNRLGRFEESVKEYDVAIGLEPKKWTAIENKGDVLMTLNRIPEAIACYREALEINPDNLKVYPYLGLLLEELGKLDEAMAAYDACLAKDPKHFQSNLFKGNQLASRGKYEDALKHYNLWINHSPPSESLTYHAAQAYLALGKKDEAMKLYNKVDQMKPAAAVQHFDRGRIYAALGQQDKAIEDYKKAQEILRTNHNTSRSPTAVRLINDALNTIVKIEDAAVETENALKKLDQNSEATKKFVTNVKLLQDKKKEIQNNIMTNVDRQQDTKAREHMAELDKLREEFDKNLQAMQKEMQSMKHEITDLRKEVKDMGGRLDDMKQELDNKLDDFSKKLNTELDKKDLTDEQKLKLNGYFKAFVGTISSAYVTAQVVDSGQVQVDAGSSAATFLSFVASFAPMVGNVLSSGITSIGEFLKNQEIIKNARRTKGLAPDSTSLSQLIGKIAYELVLNEKKQKEILEVTSDDLDKATGNMLEKLIKFCENLQEKVDAFLYTSLYNEPSQRLANNDANYAIEKWLRGGLTPFDLDKKLVREVLNQDQAPAATDKASTPQAAGGRSSCCNMF